jgi:hypothetical protein
LNKERITLENVFDLAKEQQSEEEEVENSDIDSPDEEEDQ